MTRTQTVPRLRKLREAADFTQAELANHASLARITVTRAEGGRPAYFKTIAKLAVALDVRPEDLT